LLDNGADINAADKTSGQTALMFAASLNRAEAINLLVARGAAANVITRVSELKPPAAAQTNQAAAQNRRPNVNPTVIGGLSALHFAAREGQIDAIRALIEGGANTNTPSGADQTSPITTALINGHIDIARLLLDHGADPNLANADGLTPLYATIDIRWRANAWYPQPTVEEEKTDYLDFMKDLIGHGADVNARLSKKLWYRKFRYSDDWVDPNGATAFWRAAQANDLMAMRLLVQAGANPSIPTVRGVTPLMVAAGLGFEYQTTNIAPDSRMACVRYLRNSRRPPAGLD
jgi:ankyrin repeat protein